MSRKRFDPPSGPTNDRTRWQTYRKPTIGWCATFLASVLPCSHNCAPTIASTHFWANQNLSTAPRWPVIAIGFFNGKRCYLTTHDINIIILCLCNYSFLFLSTAPITVTGTFLRQETNENYVSFFWAWGINAVVVRVGQKQKSGRARTEGLFWSLLGYVTPSCTPS